MDFFSPHIAYASEGVDRFVGNVNTLIINPLIYLLFAVALVLFLYGIVEFIMNGENDEKRTAGKQHMIWGVIGLTIMLGVFSILKIITSTFDIQGVDPKQGTVQLKDYTPSRTQFLNN